MEAAGMTDNPPNLVLGSSDVRTPERGVVSLQDDGTIQHVNARMEALLGAPARELIGMCYSDACARFLQPRVEDGEDFVRRVRTACEHSDTVEDVLAVQTDDGKITLHRYSSPMLDSRGSLVGRVEVYSDITVRRQFEQEIFERTNELALLNQELQRAQERLVHAAKLAALGELSAGVAHHLNNVLGVILGNIQLARRRDLDPWLREKLETCELAATDGANTVQRIRALARSEECLVVERIDLNAIVAEVVKLTEPKWRNESQLNGHRIELATDFGDLPHVQGNATDLREVAANVILNAVQAMPEGGRIAVTTRADGGFAVLSVADTGVGMSEETKARIFDPFYTTRGSEGTGLGMSIADAIVSKHGGDISVKSEQGKGSEIIIRLPFADSTTAEPVDARAVIPVQQSAAILVVDDEKMFGEVIGQMLVEGGHRATVVNTTSEALAVIQRGRYDILVTDLAMPSMSGCELARAAKTIDPDLAIVLMTGFDSVEDRREIEESGIDLVLGKPVQHDRLLEAMSEVLGMRAARRHAE